MTGSAMAGDNDKAIPIEMTSPADAHPLDTFSGVCERQPDAISVVSSNSAVTYSCLDRLSGIYARFLKQEGVARGDRVAIDLDRSIEYVIAILAVLKCGSSFVPLEDSLPDDRVEFICANAEAAMVITADAGGRHAGRKICRSPDPAWLSGIAPDEAIDLPKLTADQEAYVIYTSGSTGRPKGVAIPARNVDALIKSVRKVVPIPAASTWSLFHSFCFDFSIWELFGGLLSGGRVVIVAYWVARDPDKFPDLLRDQGVDVLSQTPTAFSILTGHVFGGAGPRRAPPRVRYVIFGGEALDNAVLEPWLDHPDTASAQYINMYGITETTVHVTHKRVKTADKREQGSIGQALPGWSLHVLGDDLRPVSPGDTGEIYVGGNGVAMGYVGRPDLTSERFLPDPFDARPGARLYRSGDYGTLGEDGEVRYAGRRDNQIKMRGYRIELGEIEQTIRSLRSVGEAAAVVAGSGARAKIVAFATLADPGATERDIALALRDKLPQYMFPSSIRLIESLPLTSNGKLDRASLESLAAEPAKRASAGKTSQSTDTVDTLRRIWRDALSLPNVEPNANFFALGGDSLSGISATTMAREAGFPLDLKDFFEFPTVEQLAAAVEERRGDAEHSAPEIDITAELIAAWRETFGSAVIDDTSNFFELGGDSLVGIGLVARCRRSGLGLELNDVFSFPVLGDLAGVLEGRGGSGDGVASAAGAAGAVAAFDLLDDDIAGQLSARGDLEDGYPLCALQSGMVYHCERSPGSAVYHELFGLRFAGRFDRQAFEQALADLAARHDVLRTAFLSDESGRWYQVVEREARLGCEVTDLQELGPDGAERAQQRFYREEKRRGFAWDDAPLLRVHVHRHAPGAFNVTLSCHHVILDGWSMSLLMTELFTRYAALLRGTAVDLPALATRYRDFVASEMAACEDAGHQAFWRDYLDGHEVLQLAGGASGEERGIRHHRHSLTHLLADLQRAAGDLGVPMKSLLLAAYLRCLGAVSGQRDVLTGLVANGRLEVADGEKVLGLFLNSLPLRQDLAPMRWSELVTQVFQGEQALIGHRRFPLPEIQKLAGGEALFDTLFNFVHYNVADDLAGLEEFELAGTYGDGSTNFGLVASFELQGDTLEVGLAYEAEQYDDAWIAAFGRRLERALAAIAHEPHRPHHHAALLGEDERRLLTEEWNDPAPPAAEPASILDLFARQAEARPDAVALICGDASITYAALAQRSDRMAARLARLGAGREERVALCAGRSIDMIAGMLAILKSGAAYVPLDPQYPDHHLSRIVESCWPGERRFACVATDDTIDRCRAISTRMDIATPTAEADNDPDSGTSPEAPAAPAAPAIHPEQLAYIIFTSGSSGQPKAVAIPHRGIANLASAYDGLELDQNSEVLLSPLGADEAVHSSFWACLANGRTAILMSEKSTGKGHEGRQRPLAAWLGSDRIEEICTDEPELFSTLRELIIEGDPVPTMLVNEVSSANPELRLVRAYSPDEVAGPSCVYEARAQDTGGTLVPIGKPTLRAHAYLLDGAGNLLPRFAVGEVHVGGAGLARGYLGRPGLTAERFVPDPFSGDGGRLYRTGDLGRYLPDGSIEFLGRIDDQVKIRGFRIELGEIEAVLRAHPAVERAVASVHEPSPDQKMLVAYVKPADGEPFDQDALLAFLRRRLPAPMVPAALVRVDAFALTANGKLDRKALPDPAGRGDGDAPAAPRDDRERQLVALWQDALGIEPVGIHDNFFEIGGDSIVIIQIVARARRLGLKISPRQMAERQTIAELATVMSQAQAEATEAFTGPATLLPIQQRFFDTDRTDTDHFNPAIVFRGKGLDAALLEAALAAIVQRHDVLRSRFERADDGSWRQVYGAEPPGGVLDELDLSALGEQERQQRMADAFAACQRDLDIARARLLRALLVRLPDGEDALLVTIHHLVVDAVSWRILIDDLERAYAQLEAGEPAALPPATTSPAIWAQRLESLAAGDALRELDFWQKQADTAPLPIAAADVPAKPVIHRLSLSEEETASLLRDVPRAHGAAINDILLTALARALAAHYATDRVAIELEGHGREDIFPDLDLSQSVGWFTSMYPVLLKLDPNDDIDRSVRSIRRQLARVPRGGIGYGALRYMSADRDTARSLENLPHPAVSFNYLGQFNQARDEGTRFAISDQDPGPLVSAGRRRFHTLEFNCVVTRSAMDIFVIAPSDDAKSLLEGFRGNLGELLRASNRPRKGNRRERKTPTALTEEQLLQIKKDIGS